MEELGNETREPHDCVVNLRRNPVRRKDKVVIRCGAGFAGDRPVAALKLLQRVKELDYLVLECLAERTLAERYRDAKSGGTGYDLALSFGEDTTVDEFNFGDLKYDFPGLFKDSFNDQLPLNNNNKVNVDFGDVEESVQNQIDFGEFNDSSPQEFLSANKEEFNDFEDLIISDYNSFVGVEDYWQQKICETFVDGVGACVLV